MAYLRQVYCKNSFYKKGFHQYHPVRVTDFQAAGNEVPVPNPAQFLLDHGRDYYLCCADMEAKQLIWAKSKDMAETRKAAFFFEALRLDAEELLVIPFSQLPGVAAAVANDVRHITTIFLFHTTRCGSTLLGKALEASDAMGTISVPDVYTSFYQYVSGRKDMCEEDTEMLLDLIRLTNTLYNYSLWLEDPTKTAACYKMRGQVTPMADILQKALPDAKFVLLYRSLTDTVDSYLRMMAGGSYWRYHLLTALGLDHTECRKLGFLGASLPWENPVFAAVPVPHGVVWLATCVWLGLMQKPLEMTAPGGASPRFHAVLRYEELCAYKEAMVLQVLDRLGITCGDEDSGRRIREAFRVDSQAGLLVAGRGGGSGRRWVGDREMATVSKILQHVKMGIDRSDFVLSGTLAQV